MDISEVSLYYLMMHFDNREVARLMYVSAEYRRMKKLGVPHVEGYLIIPVLSVSGDKLLFVGTDLAAVEMPHKLTSGFDTIIEAATFLAQPTFLGHHHHETAIRGMCPELRSGTLRR